MALSSAQEALASQVISELEGYLAYAWAEIGSTSTWFGADQSRTAALDSLGIYQTGIQSLKGTTLSRARSGAITFQTWSNVAKEIRSGIAYTINDSSAWSLGGVLSSAAGETYDEGKEVVKDLGGGFGIGAIVGLVFIGVVAIGWKLR